MAEPTPDGLLVEDHELKLTYRAKTSQGVRMTAGPNALARCPTCSPTWRIGVGSTVVPPLDSSAERAAPDLLRPERGQAWLHATHDQPPGLRHGMYVLACSTPSTRRSRPSPSPSCRARRTPRAIPAYDAIMGGVVSHWDEQTGDMIVRGSSAGVARASAATRTGTPAGCWASLLTNIAGSKDAVGLVAAGSAAAQGRARRPGVRPLRLRRRRTSGRSTAPSAACAWSGASRCRSTTTSASRAVMWSR